ncbi:MAG: carbon monoxide dehydrogenase subunit G [Chloroflexi bacterium]|nr:carbon monoxide dehydrogenase subunit G [Chloroflexota bacterium]
MKVNGSYTFAAPKDIIWPMLLDPHVLANVMPGCESLDPVGENEYQGILKIKVGPVQGKFKGNVLISDIVQPESYHIAVDGKGAPGFVKGAGSLRLEGNGDSAILHYEGDAQVGGRLASVGQRLLDSSAKAIIRQSLEGLENQIEYRMTAAQTDPSTGEAPPPPPPVEPPTQTEFALGIAKNMAEELFAEENQEDLIRKALIGGGFLLILYILLEWFTSRVANKVAHRVSK